MKSKPENPQTEDARLSSGWIKVRGSTLFICDFQCVIMKDLGIERAEMLNVAKGRPGFQNVEIGIQRCWRTFGMDYYGIPGNQWNNSFYTAFPAFSHRVIAETGRFIFEMYQNPYCLSHRFVYCIKMNLMLRMYLYTMFYRRLPETDTKL